MEEFAAMDADLDISPEDSPIRNEDNPTAGPSQEAENNKEPEEPEEKSAAISDNKLAAHYAH